MFRSGPTWLSPATAAGYAELLMRRRLDAAVARSRAADGPADVGASVVEWVIISALLVGIAGAVGYIMLKRLQAKANDIDLNTSTTKNDKGGVP